MLQATSGKQSYQTWLIANTDSVPERRSRLDYMAASLMLTISEGLLLSSVCTVKTLSSSALQIIPEPRGRQIDGPLLVKVSLKPVCSPALSASRRALQRIFQAGSTCRHAHVYGGGRCSRRTDLEQRRLAVRRDTSADTCALTADVQI